MQGPAEQKSKAQGTLLVVDDEIGFRDILVDLLTPFAKEIRTADNGKIALDIVKTGEIDAVLSDITMPVMNGLVFLAEVRSLHMQIPIIMLTGYGDAASIREALRLDATDFLEKPCDHAMLETAIQKALEYGLALRKLDADLEAFFRDSSLPPEKIEHIKKVRRITEGMKLGFSTYTKKAS